VCWARAPGKGGRERGREGGREGRGVPTRFFESERREMMRVGEEKGAGQREREREKEVE
jgi:hypothetical protein